MKLLRALGVSLTAIALSSCVTAPVTAPRTKLSLCPQPTYKVNPRFPYSAVNRRIDHGIVVVGVYVGASGEVLNAEVLWSKPRDVFDQNVIYAVRQWRFDGILSNAKCELEIELKLE